MIRGRAGSTFGVLALLFAFLTLEPPRAGSAASDLTILGCIDDNDTGADTCAQSTDGLDQATAAAVTADGKSVYVVSETDDAVVRFDRDPLTGALTPQGCIDDNDTGADTCAQSTDGLDGVSEIDVSPDGKSVYATSYDDGAVVRFDRDTGTGALTPAGCIDDNDTGPDVCAQSIDGLAGAGELEVSPDGKSVYLSAEGDDAVVTFDRDPLTGALTPQGCIDDNDTGPDSCAQSADGLDGAYGVTVSGDGSFVYAASRSDDAVVAFVRDSGTGVLTPAGCVDDNDTGADTCAQSTDGLAHARSIAVSPDGSTMYVASQFDDAIVMFDRDPGTGVITPMGCIDDSHSGTDACSQSTDGLNYATEIKVTGDGRSVYVESFDSDTLVGFARDTGTGALTPAGCVEDNDNTSPVCAQTTDGLNGASGLAISSGDRSLYVTAEGDDAVVTFDRRPPDTLPPQTTIKGPSKTTDHRPKFVLGSSEPGSTFQCKLDKKPLAACSSPYRTPKLGLGKHVLIARATDDAGNADPSPARKTFTVKNKH